MHDGITIRPLSTHAEYQACLDLQHATWGEDFKDLIAPSMLIVGPRLGGITAGAFDEQGRMLGFVFGLTGIEKGKAVHWSDLLAVREDARNLGLGRRLKEYQRAEMARLGVSVIYWTYDPLQTRNAHLNINVFGIRVVEYTRNMYGDTGSRLHLGTPTDRLVVAWAVDDAEMEARRREIAAARADAKFDEAPVIGDLDRPDAAAEARIGHAPCLRVAIPRDVTRHMTGERPRTIDWREANRKAFEAALGAGYDVAGFRTDDARDRGYYLLTLRDKR